jgi:hypothetical protein
MSQYLVETYLIVILAIQAVNRDGFVVREKKLISEVHFKIQEMHEAGLVTQLGSCLIDVIKTAVGKYSQMGLVSKATYPSEVDGTHTTWLNAANDKDKEGEI